MGGIQICRVHADQHHRSVDKRTNTQPGTGVVPEETDNVHYALHELGLFWNFHRSRVGVRKYNFPT